MKHFVWWDDPTAKSKVRQRAACGEWVDPRDVGFEDKEIDCPKCKEILDEHNS